MTLGQRIQELRKKAGLSQEALGEALGVSRQAVSKWEGDNGIPELDTLIAMSRLFKVALGQLLGVEEPASAEAEPTPTMDEEKVEAILRRYVEETRGQDKPKYTVGSWILAACALVVSVVIVAAAIRQIGGMRDTIRNLQSQLSSMQSNIDNVSGQVNNISNDLRDQVEQALEEGNRLTSTFDYEVYGFDLKAETVDIRLSATLKEYAAGSQVQYVLDWQKTDEIKGQTVTEPVTGPEFTTEITIPMNFHLDISLREVLPDGGHREQTVKTVYGGMHPDDFSFKVGDIFGPMNNLYIYHWSGKGVCIKSYSGLNIYSGGNDELFYPVSVHVNYVLTNPKEETTETEESLDLILEHKKGSSNWTASRERGDAWQVFPGARFDATVTIVDNLGRTFTFRDSTFVDAKGEWSGAPGAIRLDQNPEIVWPDSE